MTLREVFESLPEGEKVLLHRRPTDWRVTERDDRLARKLWDEPMVVAQQGGLTEAWQLKNSPEGVLELPADYLDTKPEVVKELQKVFPTVKKIKDIVCLMHSGYKGYRAGQSMELGWQTKRAIREALVDAGLIGYEEGRSNA